MYTLNKKYHVKVFAGGLNLNGQMKEFGAQTKKLKLHFQCALT